MSKVASNLKPIYELFIEEIKKGEPDVDILESLIDRLPKEDIKKITILNLCQKKLDKLPEMMKNYYSSSSESGERGFVSSFASK